ncbi:MAG: hypothetical protein WBB25_05290 [Sulfitobacter sp.]
MQNILILGAITLTGALLLYPPLSRAPLWRATITPLASIIGSGFLVLGPILNVNFGGWAPAMMCLLCLAAYAFGSAIRFNIAVIGDTPQDGGPLLERGLEAASAWALALAYVVSVAYYLNLFGAFGVTLTDVNDSYHARMLTTAVFVMIALVGWTRGFSAFERMEEISVGLKLAIIAGLLVGLGLFFGRTAAAGQLAFAAPAISGWPAVALAFGLIVTVQGFETSRYLGANYDAALRIRSMRLAQGLSTTIYMIYAVLLAYIFSPGDVALSETAIIEMMHVVAPILPALLVVAALAAQFSAAVADTGGSGGLVAELTGGRVSLRQAYAGLVAGGLILTWTSDVFEIISFASRGFALYYALQAGLAAVRAKRTSASLTRRAGYGGLALLGLAIALFGASVE